MDDYSHEVDLRLLLKRVWARRWWVAVSTVVCTGAFTTAAFVMIPIYRAAVVLATASSDRTGLGGAAGSALGQFGGLASLAGISLGGTQPETEEALAVLRSREFTENFINDRKLMPELYADKWDVASGHWRVPEEKQPTPARAYKLFDKKIRSVTQDKKTGLVTLQIDWKNRTEAADWANDLVQRLNLEMRSRAIKRSEGSVEYLEKELATTSVVATREAINRLIEGQVKQRMFANVNQEYVFRVVDKAIAPDADDIVSPKKALMILEGLLVGLIIGVVGALAAGPPAYKP